MRKSEIEDGCFREPVDTDIDSVSVEHPDMGDRAAMLNDHLTSGCRVFRSSEASVVESNGTVAAAGKEGVKVSRIAGITIRGGRRGERVLVSESKNVR